MPLAPRNGTPDRPTDSQIRHLNALLELSKAMAREISLEALLPIIIEKTTDILEADRTTIFLYDAKRDELWNRVAQGLHAGEIRFPASEGIAGFVARSRETVNIRDAYADPRFNPAIDRITSYRTESILCMPLIDNRGSLAGVIEVLNKKHSGGFDEDDEEFLDALAAHVCVALERAQLVENYAAQQRLRESLRVAREIQQTMLPKSAREHRARHALEVCARMLPAAEVGGDFYDYVDVDDGTFSFCIGDVSGKGVPAALIMAVTRTLLRSLMLAGLPPEECMRRANALLYPECPKPMFVTVLVGCLDPRTGYLDYCIAGHQPPVLLQSGEPPLNLDSTRGIGLCLVRDYRYASRRVTLRPGDGIFLYTDGLTEARNRAGEMFGDARLAACLAQVGGTSAEDALRLIHDGVERFAAGAAQSVDITTLLVRYLENADETSGQSI